LQPPTFKPNARRKKQDSAPLKPQSASWSPNFTNFGSICKLFLFALPHLQLSIPPLKDPEISAPVCHHNFLSSIAIQVKKVHGKGSQPTGKGGEAAMTFSLFAFVQTARFSTVYLPPPSRFPSTHPHPSRQLVENHSASKRPNPSPLLSALPRRPKHLLQLNAKGIQKTIPVQVSKVSNGTHADNCKNELPDL
jgi:hypothetical protein